MKKKTTSESHEACILLSGGIDSAACLHFFLKQKYAVSAFHVSYGQPAEEMEKRAASRVARHFGVKLKKIELTGTKRQSDGEIMGRNTLLVFAALLQRTVDRGLIVLGVHSGTPYYDCSEGFLDSVQEIMNGYTDGAVQITAPFQTWSKLDVWEFCQEEGIPIDLTYSCENGNPKPCGRCLSCQDLEELRAL